MQQSLKARRPYFPGTRSAPIRRAWIKNPHISKSRLRTPDMPAKGSKSDGGVLRLSTALRPLSLQCTESEEFQDDCLLFPLSGAPKP